MSFGKEDKIVSIRFNCFEIKKLDYVVQNSGRFYKLPVATVIKGLVDKAYEDLKSKETDKKK